MTSHPFRLETLRNPFIRLLLIRKRFDRGRCVDKYRRKSEMEIIDKLLITLLSTSLLLILVQDIKIIFTYLRS